MAPEPATAPEEEEENRPRKEEEEKKRAGIAQKNKSPADYINLRDFKKD